MALNRADGQSLSEQDAFLQAARSGDLDAVNAYIAANPNDVNYANEHSGNTALILAAGFGHVVVVRALLAAGADVAKKNQAGIDALGFARQRRQAEVVNLLENVSQQAVANTSTITPEAYLRAAGNGDVDTVRQYIQANQFNQAALNFKDLTTHENALMRAVRHGREAVIDMLLRTNLIDLRTINQRGETAAIIAQSNRHDALAAWLTQLEAFSDPNQAVSTHSSVSASMLEDDDEDLHDHALSDYLCPVSRTIFFRPVLLNPCEHAIEADYAFGEHGQTKLNKCPCCRAVIDHANPAHEAIDIARHIKSECIKNPRLYALRYFNISHLTHVLEANELDSEIGKRFITMLEHADNHLADSLDVLLSHEHGRGLLLQNTKIRDRVTPALVLNYLKGRSAKEQEDIFNKLAEIQAIAHLPFTPELREKYLAVVASTGNIDKVKLLVARGADINAVLPVLIGKHKSALLWWLHEDKAVRDTITYAGMQTSVADALLHSRKGCQLLMEDERLLGLCPVEVEGKSRAAWLAAKQTEPNFSRAGFFASPLSPEETRKKQEAKRLLECVLFPITANVAKVIELAKTQPELFFIRATAYDQAMDLEGNRRKIKGWSPYQALFGTSDNDLLGEIIPHLKDYLKNRNDNHFAENHVKEKFPDGFDFPESTVDFKLLAKAISDDQQLKETGHATPATLALLVQLQAMFKPGVVTKGHHFNMNDYIEARTIYEQNFMPWNGNQLAYFSQHVLGFLQRLKTGVYLQIDITGVNNLDSGQVSLKRDFELMNFVSKKREVVLPLDSSPGCRLGSHFLVDDLFVLGGGGGWWGCCVGGRGGALGAGSRFQKLCRAKTADLRNLCSRRDTGVKRRRGAQ